jgi:hypothetical protein
MRLIPWLSLLAMCSGCGPGRGDVNGQITYQGRRLLQGSLQVLPADKVIRYAFIENGSFHLRGLPAGAARFAVNSPDPRAQRVARRGSEHREKVEAGTAARADKWFAIPEKYASFETSGLALEIHSGENRFDIALAP